MTALSKATCEGPAPNAEAAWITVPFCDTDAMGVVHHKNYLKYLEVARTALVKRRLGSTADPSGAGQNLAVTEVNIRYLRPARFDDELQVTCRVDWCKSFSLCFKYQIFHGNTLICEAQTEHALVDAQGSLTRVSRAARAALEGRSGHGATRTLDARTEV